MPPQVQDPGNPGSILDWKPMGQKIASLIAFLGKGLSHSAQQDQLMTKSVKQTADLLLNTAKGKVSPKGGEKVTAN